MSSWLKATQRRVKETILQSVGAHDKTDDLQFDEICYKFQLFTRDITKVHMSMQLWLDSIDLFCASWIGMGESLCTFCSIPPPSTGDGINTSEAELPLYQISQAFKSIGADMNSIFKGILKTIFIDRCLKPIESILAIVPIINTKIQERKNVLLDVGFYKSKRQSELSSGKDPEHPNVVKLTNKLNESNRVLELLSNDIINCVEELSYARSSMLGPEIAALLACMETFPALIAQKVAQLHPLIPQSASTKCLLLASIEVADNNLKSTNLVESLRSDSSIFPVEPTLRRTGAVGGTAGGYGHAGFLEGLMSTVDNLLKQSSSSSNLKQASGEIDPRDSVLSSRDSQSMRITSSSNNSESSSPSSATNNRPITSTKRPVIKLGQERPISARIPNESSNEQSSRPVSAPKPSFVPPKPPDDPSNRESDDSRRIPSQKLTASALLMSGSPRRLLGATSIAEDDPDDSEDRPDTNGEVEDSLNIGFVPQSIRVNRYSTYSGDISLDEIKKSNPSSPASTANNLDPTSSIVTAPDFPSPPPEKDPTKEYVIALYKFESDVDGDLSFKRDEIIEVISKDESGWWTGSISGRTGIFPSNYVKPYE